MEKMQLNINAPSFESSYINKASAIEMKAESDTSKIPSDPKHTQTDEVSISKEGKEKQLRESTSAALRKIMGQEEVDESAQDGENSLEQMIAELKEEIAELTKKITKLRASGDEKSQEKAKALDVELAGLNSQLLELISQKLESDKNNS